MFNCHSKLISFYDEKVRLKDKQTTLREFRDRNIQRVKDGTAKLSEEEETKYPVFIEDFSQGSMAMHTINQAQNNDDHDIDHALVYKPEDVSDDPSEIRDFVLKAVTKAGGNFSTDPEARTNAVTIWYADGYHVDLAIYKKVDDEGGGHTYFHAGQTWQKRDPKAINDWFTKAVSEKSPDSGQEHVKVASGQLRRIVRLIKFWSKSRAKWSLPSGLVLTVLAVENYRSNEVRDDIALYDTLKAISDRIKWNKEVLNPVDSSKSLLTEEEHRKQMTSLESRLNQTLSRLQPLFGHNCSEVEAFKAWGKAYNNPWWSAELKKSESRDLTTYVPFAVSVKAFRRVGGYKIDYDPEGNRVIPKGMKIQFRLSTGSLGVPDRIEWEVRNEGDEAEWAEQVRPRIGLFDESNPYICNENSAYRGNHIMVCRVYKDGQVYEKLMEVRIR